MRESVWIAGACSLLVACGGAGLPETPPTTGPRRSSTSLPGSSAPTLSKCSSASDCQRDCERGAANACTRLGDHVYTGRAGPGRGSLGRRLQGRRWPPAVRAAHAGHRGERRGLDGYGWRACLLGGATVCEFLGNAIFVRAMAPGPDEDARGALPGERATVSPGLPAGQLARLRSRGGEPAPGRAARTRGRGAASGPRGFDLADAKCKDGGRAVRLPRSVGGESGRRGQGEDVVRPGLSRAARPEHPRTATAHMRNALLCQRAKERVWRRPTCETAALSGPSRAADRPNRRSRRRVSPATRSSSPRPRSPGTSRTTTSRGSSRRRSYASRSWGWCPTLDIQLASGSTAYDRILFEGMRTWRYRPGMLDGQPVPVCSDITFIYRPNRQMIGWR